MPLITTPKAGSASSNTPSKVITTQQVTISRPNASTARATALKQRLSGVTPAAPVAPRPTGSSARREEMSKLTKFNSPAANTFRTQPHTSQNTSSRGGSVNLEGIAPPPSGLAPGSIQQAISIEAPETRIEATNETLNPQFVALARKERQLRKAQQELKAQQDAWKQEQAGYIPKQQLTSDTLKVLSEAGITPDKLVELQINQATANTPEQLLLNRIAELENRLKGIDDPETGTLAQRDKQAYDSAVSQIRSDAKLLVDSNPDFGTIKSERKLEDVVELITSVFDEEGIVLDVEEAAGLVENKLVDNLYKQYERISQYEKVRSRLRPTSETSEVNNEQRSPAPRVNTLTNTGAVQRPLTPRERAIAKVQQAIDSRNRK